MKKMILIGIIILSMLLPAVAYAGEGDSGYEGGVSAAQASYKAAPTKITYDYQELCLVSGKPFVLKGTLTISKSMKKDVVTAKYDYDLKNVDTLATLKRSLQYTTTGTQKDNNQTIESTVFSKKPTEVIKIDKSTYTMQNYEFTRSNLVDNKPAINYYAGNFRGKKTFQMSAPSGTTTSAATTTVTVEEIGEFYGYDQYWGATETQIIDYIIQSEKKDGENVEKWGGTANINVSSTSVKQLKYVENQPDQISFAGGYVQVQHNESVMEYHLKLPEFDAKGISTDMVNNTDSSLKLETFPTETRLPVPDLTHLRGHPAENDIKTLYSLEVFQGNDTLFNPQQYMTRADFAVAIARAAKEVPQDPALAAKTATKATSKNTKQQVTATYKDVSVENLYFDQIENVTQRGIMVGTGSNEFKPTDNLTIVDVAAIFVRALGLENLAPNPVPVTTFKDNDKIAYFARKGVYVADKIGLLEADDKGNLNPTRKLTKAKAAELLNTFIEYMRDGIQEDYRENIVNY